MNPMAMMQMKSLFSKFKRNHPKVPQFFAAASRCVNVGSVIEIQVTHRLRSYRRHYQAAAK